MNPNIVWVLVIIACIVVGGVVWYAMTRNRSRRLHDRFGREYDRAVEQHGSRREAEAELESRARRVEQLDIRALEPERRSRYIEAWRSEQALFVDDPPQAVTRADRLVEEVMRERGYPVGDEDFEQRAADISVDHPKVVENYRIAHEIALRHRRGQASTEDLRKAMVHYRALFEDLLDVSRTMGAH